MLKKGKFLFLLVAISVAAGIGLCIFFLFLRGPKKIKEDFRGIAQFTFNDKNALRGWEEKIFKNKVIYSISREREEAHLDAYSKKAASALLYWVKFKPVEKPMVSWKWRVTEFPQKKAGLYEEGAWVEKEDYAARFYVIFPKFPFYRLQCLEYVWDKDSPEGTVITNPNFKNLRIMVLESGEKNLGRWVSEERNVYEDFKKVFGTATPGVGAIAVMTDSDNTLSTAKAQYDDIKVGYDE